MFKSGAAVRLGLTAIALTLTVIGCSNIDQGEPARFLVHEPPFLPERSEAPLGGSVQLSGRVMDYQDGRVLPISLTWPPEKRIGEVQADGTFQASLSAPAATGPLRVESLLWGEEAGPTAGSVCPVATLRAEPAGVPARGVHDLRVPLAQSDGDTSPLTSPPPPTYRRLVPAPPAHELTLVFVQRDVRVTGERKCIEVHPDGVKIQFNLYANLVLRQGWNRLARHRVSESVGDVRIHRTYLEVRPMLEISEWRLVY